jgi:hypothetical protein
VVGTERGVKVEVESREAIKGKKKEGNNQG